MFDKYKVFIYSSTNLHNAHKQMMANPPNGFEYQKDEYLVSPIRSSSNSFIKSTFEKIRWIVSPHYNYLHVMLGKPKIRKFYSNDYNLIHSAQSLLDTNLPYVMDFEHAAVLSGYNQIAFSNPSFVKNLKKILENKKLKKLLPWTNAAKNSLLNFLSSEQIEYKIETVYPVITPPEKIEKKEDKTIKFLFIGGNFYEKGGLETLIAFDRISPKYDIELTIISNLPQEIKKKFAKNPKITMNERVPYEKAQKLYDKSNIFVMPTHMDTFGFVILEALSYGLPVIVENSFSRPELIAEEKTGLLIKSYYSCFGSKGEYSYPTNSELYKKRLEACKNPPGWYINQLANAMERFVLDSKLRYRCSRNARLETTEGKFSPKIWKKKMSIIYRQALDQA